MKKVFLLLSVFMLLLPSCATQERTKISVIQDSEAETRVELTGKWNDADLRDTAKTLINQMLSEGWYNRALSKKGDLPDIKIGKIKNKTYEHLPIKSFIDSMQRTLINSGKIYFVGDKSESMDIRSEKDDQMNNASDDSVKEAGQEAGADYMVFGQFSSMNERLGGKEVKYLQVNLKLIDIEKNRIVWVGEKKIKKIVQQPSRTW